MTEADSREISKIVERCQRGDRAAYGQLYNVSRDRLRTICMHYVKNEAIADDLLHDAFIIIFTRIVHLKNPEKAAWWMNTVTRNVARLFLREKKRRRQMQLYLDDDGLMVSSAEVSYDEIMDYINALPEGYGRVFRLSVLEGLSHEQIADLLHIAPHSSASQLLRARHLLQGWLRPLVLLLLAVALPLGVVVLRRQAERPVVHGGRVQTAIPAPVEKSALEKDASLCVGAVGSSGSSSAVLASQNRKKPVSMVSEEHQDTMAVAVTHDVLEQHDDSLQDGKTPSVENSVVTGNLSADQYVTGTENKDGGRWTLALSYNGLSTAGRQLPDADAYNNQAISDDTITRHRMPLTVSLSMHYRLGEHWRLGMGVQYTRLITEQIIGNSYASLLTTQHVNYIDLPITLSWHQSLSRRWNLYSTAGVSLHLPLRSTQESVYVLEGGNFDASGLRVHPGVMWSAEVGVGAEYQLTPHLGFFIEPRLNHYFKNGSGVETWHTAHPVSFTLPVGFRLCW